MMEGGTPFLFLIAFTFPSSEESRAFILCRLNEESFSESAHNEVAHKLPETTDRAHSVSGASISLMTSFSNVTSTQ